MTDAQKLEEIRKRILEWDDQADPKPGEDENPEAADVMYSILGLIGE